MQIKPCDTDLKAYILHLDSKYEFRYYRCGERFFRVDYGYDTNELEPTRTVTELTHKLHEFKFPL